MGAVHESLGSEATQHPGQFEDLGNVRLPVKNGFRWIEAECEVGGRDIPHVFPHLRSGMHRSQRVVIRDEIEGFVVARQFQGGPDGSQPVPEMRLARGFDSG